MLIWSVAPHCRIKIQGAGLDPHLGGGDGRFREEMGGFMDQGWRRVRFRDQGWRRVGLGEEMGGFMDQGVETGRFRYVLGGRSWIWI